MQADAPASPEPERGALVPAWVSYTLLGVGGAGLVLGGLYTAKAGKDADKAEGLPDGKRRAALENDFDRHRTLGYTGLGVGGALLAAGGAYTGAANGTWIYSAERDVEHAPFTVAADVRAGDSVWLVTWGDNGYTPQVVGVWSTEASMDTYSWVTGSSCLIRSGNCAFVTMKLEIWRSWRQRSISLMRGYMMGSPTKESAQCLTVKPSCSRSGSTPGTPLISLIML
jgi:hypothetical protein